MTDEKYDEGDYFRYHTLESHNLPDVSSFPPTVKLYREEVMQWRQDYNLLVDFAAEVTGQRREFLTPFALLLYLRWYREQEKRNVSVPQPKKKET